ncbi:hypothetical protein U3516DRAFT_532531, partial [Neocallimastix sp. 'constans']
NFINYNLSNSNFTNSNFKEFQNISISNLGFKKFYYKLSQKEINNNADNDFINNRNSYLISLYIKNLLTFEKKKNASTSDIDNNNNIIRTSNKSKISKSASDHSIEKINENVIKIDNMKLEIKSSDKVEDKKKLSKKQKLKNIEANTENTENNMKIRKLSNNTKPQDIKITMLKIELQKNNEKLIQNQPKIKSMTNNFKKNINVIDKTINDNNAVDGEEDKLNSNEQNKEILQNSKNEIIGKKPQKRKKSKSDIMEENSKYFSKRIKVAINNKDNSNKLMQDFYRINNNISNKNNNNKSSDKAELIYNNVKNNESCQNTQNSNPIETTDSNNNNNNKLSKSSDTDLNNNNGEYKKKKKENDNDKSNKAIKRKLEAKGLDLRESKKRIIESNKTNQIDKTLMNKRSNGISNNKHNKNNKEYVNTNNNNIISTTVPTTILQTTSNPASNKTVKKSNNYSKDISFNNGNDIIKNSLIPLVDNELKSVSIRKKQSYHSKIPTFNQKEFISSINKSLGHEKGIKKVLFHISDHLPTTKENDCTIENKISKSFLIEEKNVKDILSSSLSHPLNTEKNNEKLLSSALMKEENIKNIPLSVSKHSLNIEKDDEKNSSSSLKNSLNTDFIAKEVSSSILKQSINDNNDVKTKSSLNSENTSNTEKNTKIGSSKDSTYMENNIEKDSSSTSKNVSEIKENKFNKEKNNEKSKLLLNMKINNDVSSCEQIFNEEKNKDNESLKHLISKENDIQKVFPKNSKNLPNSLNSLNDSENTGPLGLRSILNSKQNLNEELIEIHKSFKNSEQKIKQPSSSTSLLELKKKRNKLHFENKSLLMNDYNKVYNSFSPSKYPSNIKEDLKKSTLLQLDSNNSTSSSSSTILVLKDDKEKLESLTARESYIKKVKKDSTRRTDLISSSSPSTSTDEKRNLNSTLIDKEKNSLSNNFEFDICIRNNNNKSSYSNNKLAENKDNININSLIFNPSVTSNDKKIINIVPDNENILNKKEKKMKLEAHNSSILETNTQSNNVIPNINNIEIETVYNSDSSDNSLKNSLTDVIDDSENDDNIYKNSVDSIIINDKEDYVGLSKKRKRSKVKKTSIRHNNLKDKKYLNYDDGLIDSNNSNDSDDSDLKIISYVNNKSSKDKSLLNNNNSNALINMNYDVNNQSYENDDILDIMDNLSVVKNEEVKLINHANFIPSSSKTKQYINISDKNSYSSSSFEENDNKNYKNREIKKEYISEEKITNSDDEEGIENNNELSVIIITDSSSVTPPPPDLSINKNIDTETIKKSLNHYNNNSNLIVHSLNNNNFGIYVNLPSKQTKEFKEIKEVLSRSQIRQCLKTLHHSRRFPTRRRSPRMYTSGSKIFYFTKNQPYNYYQKYSKNSLKLLVSNKVHITFIRSLICRIQWKDAWKLLNSKILATFLRIQLENYRYKNKFKNYDILNENNSGKMIIKKERGNHRKRSRSKINYYHHRKNDNKSKEKEKKREKEKKKEKEKEIEIEDISINEENKENKDENIPLLKNIRNSSNIKQYPLISKTKLFSTVYNNRLMELLELNDLNSLLKNLYYINQPINSYFKYNTLKYLKNFETKKLNTKSNVNDLNKYSYFKDKNYFEWECPMDHCHKKYYLSIYAPKVHDILENKKIFSKNWYKRNPHYKRYHGHCRVARIFNSFYESHLNNLKQIDDLKIIDHLLEHRRVITECLNKKIKEKKEIEPNYKSPKSLLTIKSSLNSYELIDFANNDDKNNDDTILFFNDTNNSELEASSSSSINNVNNSKNEALPYHSLFNRNTFEFYPQVNVNIKVNSDMMHGYDLFKEKLKEKIKEHEQKETQSKSIISKSYNNKYFI